ncbi:MAG: glycosyltransferase [Cryomorphaceae bacterium]|nr:glycosyltransferase [Cryomorphaceae bacterium]
MQPLVTVIIPVFNAAKTLEATLKSVIQQTATTEIVVIDGGSTDGSLDIINTYITHIATFVTESDLGVYDAMNKGFSKAKGDFIYFLGADDQLHDSTVFSRLLADVEQADLIAGIVQQMPPRHPRIKEWNNPEWNWKLNLRHTLHHQGVLYRRTVMPEVPFDIRYKILADYALHLSLFKTGRRVRISDIHIADCGSEGISKTFDSNLYKEEWQIKKNLLSLPWKFFQLFWLPLKYLYKQF